MDFLCYRLYDGRINLLFEQNALSLDPLTKSGVICMTNHIRPLIPNWQPKLFLQLLLDFIGVFHVCEMLLEHSIRGTGPCYALCLLNSANCPQKEKVR